MPNPLDSLRDYLAWLEERGLLLRIREELSPILEIPSLLRRVMYAGGPTVLVENVRGYPEWRVAGNIFRSVETFKDALGVDSLESVGERVSSLVKSPPPVSLREKFARLSEIKSMASYMPKKTRKASFNEEKIEQDPLDKLPAFKTWPGDGGRYITLGVVITRDPESGTTNMSVYRVMLASGDRAVIHWQFHKRGARAYYEAWRRGEKLPVAIALGADPVSVFAGVAPVPYPMDKLLFAGMIKGKGLEVYELDNGLLVPATAEAVIEGYVEPGVLAQEGPFGDHWGFYDKPVEKYPVMKVEKLWRRDKPIYSGTVVGLPPLEDAVIGKIIERVFKPVMKMVFPEIVDVNFPVYGVFQGIMIVSIRKRYPWHGKKVIQGLWGVGQTSLTKMIVVVDEFIDVHDMGQVQWAVSSFVNPARDIVILDNVHTDVLDPSSTAPGVGSKMGIDATRKLPEEAGRDAPEIVAPDPDVEEKISGILEKYGITVRDPWERVVKGYQDLIRAW